VQPTLHINTCVRVCVVCVRAWCVCVCGHLSELHGFLNDARPALALEAQVLGHDGRQLQEVAAEDHLDAAERSLVLPDLPRHVLHLVEEFPRQHRNLHMCECAVARVRVRVRVRFVSCVLLSCVCDAMSYDW
jgi:hypothetical protein